MNGHEIAEDMDKLETLLKQLIHFFAVPKDIAEDLINKYKREYKEDPSLVAIMKHLAKGGKVNTIVIDPENLADFRKIMQERHIDYCENELTREDGTKAGLFIFKDCDRIEVDRIRQAYQLSISNNSKELTVSEFKEMMRGKQIGVASNLSIEDVFAFRNNVAETDLKYVVLKDKGDKYKIYASDSEKLTDVMLKVSYDIANDTENEFANDVAIYRTQKKELLEKLGDKEEQYVIADKDNPNNFIYMDKKGYSLHKFDKVLEEVDGVAVERIRDIIKPDIHDVKDRAFFLKAVGQISKPVIIPASEFALLKELDRDGRAYASDDIEKAYVDFIEMHRKTIVCLSHYPKIQPKYKEDDLEGYVSLPQALVIRMQKDFPYLRSNGVNQIAFPKDKKEEIDAYLETNLLSKIPDPMLRTSFEWKMQGRSGDFQPELSAEVNRPFYILNANDPSSVLSVDVDGLHFYKNGQEVGNCPNISEDYMTRLAQYTDKSFNPNPVVLTMEEMTSSDRDKIITDRANHYTNNEVISMMCHMEELEKKNLVENKERLSEAKLSPEQEKAVEKHGKLSITIKGYDGAVFADMQDFKENKEYTLHSEIDF